MKLDLKDSYHLLFWEETKDQLESLENKLLGLEQMPDDETIHQVFRLAHSIKGAAATMEIDDMVAVAHELETLLTAIRDKALELNGALIEIALKDVDRLKDIFGSLTNDVSEAETCLLVVRFEEDAMLLSVKSYMIVEALGDDVMILGTKPEDYENADDESFEGTFTLRLRHTKNDAVIRNAISRITDIESYEIRYEEADAPLVSTPQNESGQISSKLEGESDKKAPERSTVRVTNEKVNELINLIGELTTDKEMLQDIGKSLKKKYPKDKDVIRLIDVQAHLSQLSGFLQDLALSTRLVPIERIFNRFPRMVRDLSVRCGKSVELVIEGQHTGIDRSLLEAIVDPINHILRNAIDHGMESPEERHACGKPSKGSVLLKATHNENRVIISITDDGKGIDPERIRAVCVERKLLDPVEMTAMKDDEVIQYLFKPGFSTADSVSDISGRGVGLDAALSTVRSLGGFISLRSRKGEGTSFIIELPLTMAIMRAMIVREGRFTFAIPVSGIVELLSFKEMNGRHRVTSMGGQETMEWREHVIPMKNLSEHFNISSSANESNNRHIMVLGHGDSRLALKVERVTGEQEIVLKPIGEYIGERRVLGSLKGISGVSTLGDGRFALIVDIQDIFQ